MEEQLKSLGLNDNEVKTYLELLRLDASKANIIAKRLNLPRTTVYNILDSLISKGLVSYVVKLGIRYFEAVDPKRLLIIEQEKLTNLKFIMPNLEKIKKTVGKRPTVEIYEGKEGIKTILEEILKMPEKSILYGYVNNDLFEHLQFYFPNFIKRRVQNKINVKIIQEENPNMKELRQKGKELLLDMKFSPEIFKSNVFIFDNKIALLTFSKQILLGILIENESIAMTQKQVFNILWKVSK